MVSFLQKSEAHSDLLANKECAYDPERSVKSRNKGEKKRRNFSKKLDQMTTHFHGLRETSIVGFLHAPKSFIQTLGYITQ